MHGESYVESYADHSLARLTRLMPHIRLQASDRVADFACGNGMLMDVVAPQVHSYVGVDFSAPFIAAAEQRRDRAAIANAEFVCSEIGEFCQARPAEFDVAFALDLSQHVYDSQWLEVLQEIRTSLKPGGRFYMHTPNAQFFLEMMKNRGIVLKQLPQHVAPRSPQHSKDLIKQAGFRELELMLVPHYNVLRFLHPLSYVPVIGRYFKARILISAKA